MNIYEKMIEATKRIATVAKNLQVETGYNKSYKAVSEADVLAAVKPIEVELGIYSYPVQREIVEAGTITSQTKNGEAKRLFMRLQTVYRFVNTEKPDEFIEITTYGDGVDSQDKAPGKAMTYADKYALLKAYKVQTGDDPDKYASEDLVSATLSADESKPATERERKQFMDECDMRGLDAVEVLKKVGWSGGKMTRAQWAKALYEATK